MIRNVYLDLIWRRVHVFRPALFVAVLEVLIIVGASAKRACFGVAVFASRFLRFACWRRGFFLEIPSSWSVLCSTLLIVTVHHVGKGCVSHFLMLCVLASSLLLKWMLVFGEMWRAGFLVVELYYELEELGMDNEISQQVMSHYSHGSMCETGSSVSIWFCCFVLVDVGVF